MKKILFITALLLFSFSLAAAQSEVLVSGNPPLTQENFDSIAEYYERGLEIEFTSRERDELQEIVSKNWRKAQKSNPQSLTGWLTTITKINGIGGEKREKIKGEIRNAVLGDLRASSNTELSRFVLDVYENSGSYDDSQTATTQNENTNSDEAAQTKDEERETRAASTNSEITPYTDEYKPVQGGISLADLAGKWSKSTVSASGYRNVVTGDYKSGYGFSNQHEISSNGAFNYYNFATVSLYDCTTELFTRMKGRAQLNGSLVTFTYVSGTVDIKDSCKKSTLTKPAQVEKTTYRLERGRKYLRMCEVGKETYCIYKSEE